MAREEKHVHHIHVNTSPLVLGPKIFPSSNEFSLRESDLEVARIELRETEEMIKHSLKELKQKLSIEGINYRPDDDYLLRQLRVRKYDCDKAFTIIRDMYSRRRKYPNLFSLPSNLELMLNKEFVTYLPYTDQDRRVIILIRFGNWDPRISFAEYAPAVFAVLDIAVMNPHCQINGIRSIWDTEGTTLRHVPDIMRYSLLMLPMIQESYPWRIKDVILINCSALHKEIYKRLRFLIKKKIYERIKVLGYDHSELHELINPTLLPKKYGGSLEENETNVTQHVLDNLPYLRYERSFGCKFGN